MNVALTPGTTNAQGGPGWKRKTGFERITFVLFQVSDDEYNKLLSQGIKPTLAIDSSFGKFIYTPRSLPEDDTSMVSTDPCPSCKTYAKTHTHTHAHPSCPGCPEAFNTFLFLIN